MLKARKVHRFLEYRALIAQNAYRHAGENHQDEPLELMALELVLPQGSQRHREQPCLLIP